MSDKLPTILSYKYLPHIYETAVPFLTNSSDRPSQKLQTHYYGHKHMYKFRFTIERTENPIFFIDKYRYFVRKRDVLGVKLLFCTTIGLVYGYC